MKWNEAQRRDPFAVGWYEDFRGIILTNAGRYREALACYAKMATDHRGRSFISSICHAELGETRQAEAAFAKLKSSRYYLQFPGITLDDIMKEEVIHEDPAIFDRYRAILERIDGSG